MYRIETVFIPVSEIQSAREWYSSVLGIEFGEVQFEHLCVAEMQGATVILDMMPKWRNENGELPVLQAPVIQFGTDDIEASFHKMKDKDVEMVTGIEHGHYFVFNDPDGNRLMVSQC